jgi:hypothetical protein
MYEVRSSLQDTLDRLIPLPLGTRRCFECNAIERISIYLGYVPGRDQLALGRVVLLLVVVHHVDRGEGGVAGNRAGPPQQKVALSLLPLAVLVGLPVLTLDLVVL